MTIPNIWKNKSHVPVTTNQVCLIQVKHLIPAGKWAALYAACTGILPVDTKIIDDDCVFKKKGEQFPRRET